MALFKVNRGTNTKLPAEMHDGWAYFCTDTAEFFIDYADPAGELHRKQINANEAKKLIGYDISNILDNSDIEIPTSAAVFNAIKNGAVSWNDLQDKPFGDNADGTVNQMSGKYVEGMGYKETKKTVIFSGNVEMVGKELGDVLIAQGTVPSGLSSIPEDLTITVDGVSTVIKVDVGSFAYNGKDVLVGRSKDDSGNWTNLSFFSDGNTDYTIEDITIEAVTEIIHPIDEKFLPDTVATKEYVDSAIGANKDVFFATYGTTTLSEILTAYTSGKNIVCSYPDKNLFANLTKVQATKWVPAAVDGTSYTGQTVTIPSINMMPTEFEYVISAVDQYRVTTATGVYPFSFGDADEVIVAKSDTSIVKGLSITRNGNLMGFQSDNWDAMGSKTAALKIESLANTSVDGSDVECTVTFSAALDNTIVVLILSADGSWSSTSSKLADVEYVDSAIGAAIGGSY